MDLKKQFLEECGVDLTDYEYAGKFPSRNKKGVWGNIPRGEGWKRYAEWLESKLKNNGGLGDVSVSLFNEALRVMRDLAEHQNAAPLIRHEEEYNKTMTEVWDFLEANET